eukprot:TRINITY_DN908_c0_g2_i1.p1 TRINITY_DN908_c0_g2~~TRINITY_DN908_c0_g2_i1.p1  ORF type:complete len:1309 (+),score=299.12 TRINITY_DN908_c0_g2_i1:103-3927(+)
MPASAHPAPPAGGAEPGLTTAEGLRRLRDEALHRLAAAPADADSPAAAVSPLQTLRPAWSPVPPDRPARSPVPPEQFPGQVKSPAQLPTSPPTHNVDVVVACSSGTNASGSSSPPSPPTQEGGNPLLRRFGRRRSRPNPAPSVASVASVAAPKGSKVKGIGQRLADGLEAGSYAEGETRVKVLQDLMRARTLHREDYPKEGDWCPGILDWAATFPALFNQVFTPGEREELGAMYTPSDPRPLQFYYEDMIQLAGERLPCGACAPRTPLRECGIHGTADLATCSRAASCLQAGNSRGAATCLFDNLVRVLGRVIDALHGKQPLLLPAHIPPELAVLLDGIPPEEAAEGVAAIAAFSYEIKAPPDSPDRLADGSRPTQLYRLLGCAMRNLGDPTSRARLSADQLELWERVVELMRPFSWRLDRFLLALPHQPRVVYRGINKRVSDNYNVGSIVLWPPVTSTSASRDVAWEFMSQDGSGTFFIILTLSVAVIAPFSWLPGEEEWLLHSLSVHKVTDIMQPGLRAIVGTNHDMVCLVQVDGRGERLSAAEMVQARALALRIQTLLFDSFLCTYVPPVVTVGCTADGVAAAQGRRSLGSAVREWCCSESRAVLVVGDGGCGKTSTSLWLTRAAAAERDPLPWGPGCKQPWLPVHVTLPVVPNLLQPGTGEGHAVRPLTDFIARSNNLNAEELAEMQKLPLLLVLDALEELPEGLSRLRGRGLLSAGGLNLREWPNAKVVLCIRSEMLRQAHGCTRWHLTAHDVLPEAELWHVQSFDEESVIEYSEKVVRREMLAIAKAGAELESGGESEPALARSLQRLRCAQPPYDAALALQSAARQLLEEGAAPDEAAEAALETDAGAACRAEMLAATESVVARMRAADPVLITSPFVLSMAVSAGQVLAEVDMSSGARRAIFGAWARAEVRRRLPRIASLADSCPEFAAMDEDARVELVLDFYGALACSGIFIEVVPSLLLIARLHRYASIARVADYNLSPLGAEHNQTLLGAAPLRVETTKGGLLSFPHAFIHAFVAADRVRRLSSLEGAGQHPDVQRVALVLPRSVSLQQATREAMAVSTTDPIGPLRRRLVTLRYVQGTCLTLWLASVALNNRRTQWFDWLRIVGYTVLILQLTLPRRWRKGHVIKWHHLACGMTLAMISAHRILEILQCDTPDSETTRAACEKFHSMVILEIVFYVIPVHFIALQPHYFIAALGGLNPFEFHSHMHHRASVAACTSCTCFMVYATAVLLSELWLWALTNLILASIYACTGYRMLRLTVRVQR